MAEKQIDKILLKRSESQSSNDEAVLSGYTGRKDIIMKNYYLATYKKSDGIYDTVLVLTDSVEKAEEHFKAYAMATVRIAAEDEIYYYRSKGCPVVEL